MLKASCYPTGCPTFSNNADVHQKNHEIFETKILQNILVLKTNNWKYFKITKKSQPNELDRKFLLKIKSDWINIEFEYNFWRTESYILK